MRKTIVFALFAVILLSINLKADDIKTAVIKSSVWCEHCDATVHKGLKKLPAIKEVKVDLDKKEITVKYDAGKTSLEKVRTAISKLGYDADDIPADRAAYRKLPNCCKNPEDRK